MAGRRSRTRHGKVAKILSLQWKRNRPSDLLNATSGNPRSRARTPLPATLHTRIIKSWKMSRVALRRQSRGFSWAVPREFFASD